MTITIDKIDKLLETNGMVCNKFYVNKHRYCMFIEVIVARSARTFFLSIPDRNKVVIPSGTNVFELRDISIVGGGDTIDKYTDMDVNRIATDDKYTGVNLIADENKTYRNEDDVELKYDNRIGLNDSGIDNVTPVIQRQVKRLNLCVQDTKYSIHILTRDYIFTPEGRVYGINTKDGIKDKRRSMTTITIANMLERIKSAPNDLTSIDKGLQTIIIKNISSHLQTISENLTNHHQVKSKIMLSLAKRDEYITRMSTLVAGIEKAAINEADLVEKRRTTLENYSAKRNGLVRDVDKTRITREYNSKLITIDNDRKDMIRNVMSIKLKMDDLVLTTESSMFDVVIMVENIKARLNHI